MKCLTHAECVEWMRLRFPQGTPFEPNTCLPQLGVVGYHATAFSLPEDSGKKVWLCHVISRWLGGDVLVYLQNWSIFPSSGHVPLLTRLREALGEARSPEVAPGHIFEINEADDAVSVMVLAAEFFWDCLMVSQTGQRVAYFSHDEACDLLSTDKEELHRARENIAASAATR